MFSIKNGSNGTTALTHKDSGLKMRLKGIAQTDDEALSLIKASQSVKVSGSWDGQTFKGRNGSEFLGEQLYNQLMGIETPSADVPPSAPSADVPPSEKLADEIVQNRTKPVKASRQTV